MKSTIQSIFLLVLVGFIMPGCKNRTSTTNNQQTQKMEKGTYGYDKAFLNKHIKVVELKEGNAAVALVPEYQGRVMTSSCNGDQGFSFGWINYDLIKEGKKVPHFNPFGGEERFWIGPEGGQYSIYFKKGKKFVFDNWFVPSSIDTEPFELVSHTDHKALFKKKIELTNHSGFTFNLEVNRNISLLTPKEVSGNLKVETTDLSIVAYESQNTIKNTGAESWDKETGLLSIWMLGMMIPSPEVTVVIPVKEGGTDEIGPMVNDDYFGRIGKDRLVTKNNTVFFKADGTSRGKIGIPPLRANRFMGSYDAQNQVLTILECLLPENRKEFVNSAWELQENPYSGDALNSYNDGPLEDGSQMGPFYELESSSPALALNPSETYTHIQRTYHFKGDKEALNKISQAILKVSIEEIEAIF